MAYDAKAKEIGFSFFSRGYSKEKALREMQKIYPGLSGSTWDSWVEKGEWKARRATLDLKAREFDELCQDTARILIAELNEIREKLISSVRDGKVDNQTVYAYTSTARQIADLSRQHIAGRDPRRIAAQTLMEVIEKLLSRLRELPGLAAPLEANAKGVGEIVTNLGEEYGAE